MNANDRFSADELNGFQAALANKRSQLIDERNDLLRNLDEISDTRRDELSRIHPGDRGTLEFDQEMSYDSVERVTLELSNISQAESRIDTGDYGTCAECGEEIPTARLLAVPEAKLCSECQRRLEDYQRQHRHVPQFIR